MPKIRIIGTVLPKAVSGFEVDPGYDWTNFKPNPYTPTSASLFGTPALNISYRKPTDLSDPGMQMPFDEAEDAAIKAEQKQIQNKENWTNDPRNQMTGTGFGKDFYESLGITPPKYDASKQYNTKGKETKPLNIAKGLNNFSKLSENIQTGINAIGAGVNLYDTWKKQKEYDQWSRNSRLPDNYYAVNTGEDRGDYDINDGMFRPNELGYKSKGTQANAYYASQNFTKYGGIIKAADGLLVPGDQIVQQAYIPSLPPVNIPVTPAPQVQSVPTVKRSGAKPIITNKGSDVATRTNNPGNILYKPIFAKLFGALDSGIKQVDGTGTFAYFPDVETGLKARESQMFGEVDGTFKSRYYKPNTTVDQALRTWSNNGYNGKLYPEIANKTLAEVTPQERNELLKRQIKMESGSMYKKLKQAGIFANGGEQLNNDDMKIRITGLPDNIEMAHGGQPPYSGQSNYGLYIGQRNLYRTMAKHSFDDASKTVTEEEPTPDNPHVLEAEGAGPGKAGETILRPDGTHMDIVGPTHAQNGVKLTKEQAPQGSFIYSNTKKLKIKDPNVLKHFNKGGKVKGGFTPAEIARQYDTNKYRAILNDPTTDNLQKSTAKKMLESYERKLAELALVQEGMKGFPQGIPEVATSIVPQQGGKQGQAAYGGYFDDGGQPGNPTPPAVGYDPFGIGKLADAARAGTLAKNYPSWFTPWMASNTTAGATSPTGKPTVFDPKNPNPFYVDYDKWKKLNNNQDFNDPEEYQNFIYDYVNQADPAAIDKMWDNWGTTAKGKTIPKEGRTRKAFADRFFGARTAEIAGHTDKIPLVPRPKGKATVTVTSDIDETKDTPTPPSLTPPNSTPPQEVPGKAGWTSQDLRNRNNALIDYATLKKYHGYAPTLQPVLPSFIPQDWRGYAASLQSQQNAGANQLATYQPGQGLASNLSFLQGQTGNALADYISKVDQYNATGASNMDAQRANILNQYSQANAASRKGLWDEENVYDDRWRSAERLARKGVVAAQNTGEDTASKLYNQNLTEKYFKIDPYTQRMVFNPEGGKAAWEAATKGGYSDPQTAADIYNSTYDTVHGNDEAKRSAAEIAMRNYLNGSSNKEVTSTYPYSPKKNNTKVTKDVEEGKYGGTPNAGYAYFNPFLR